MGGADALTQDTILGGRVRILQPRDGSRAGIDAVLLAASVPAEPGDAVLELGCGVGSASLCLAARVPGLSLVGIEIQEEYAELAKRNAAQADVGLTVMQGDVAALPEAVRQRQFDQVLANPPYYFPEAREAAQNSGRDYALAERTPLAEWVRAATRRLVPGGTLTMIQSAERLPDLVTALVEFQFGAIEALPLLPRAERPARFVILRGRKGRKTPFRLHAPVCLHDGAAHVSDADGYSARINKILRDAAPLEFGAD